MTLEEAIIQLSQRRVECARNEDEAAGKKATYAAQGWAFRGAELERTLDILRQVNPNA